MAVKPPRPSLPIGTPRVSSARRCCGSYERSEQRSLRQPAPSELISDRFADDPMSSRAEMGAAGQRDTSGMGGGECREQVETDDVSGSACVHEGIGHSSAFTREFVAKWAADDQWMSTGGANFRDEP